MQKKKNIKSKLIDLITILLCIAASAVSGNAFLQEYTRTLTKLNEAPVGSIVFKKRTAQRKFIDRAVWDTLKQKSAVYNADTIRTINASEAVILFKDESTHIAMNANTIIQIFYNDKEGARIDFFGGNLDVNSGSGGVTITSGSAEIFVAGQASLNKKDEGFTLSVTEGEAALNGEIIETGEILILDEQGERKEAPAIMVTSFGSSARIISAPRAATPVDFSWNTYNFNPDSFVIIETALDPSFEYIAQAMEVTNGTTARLYIDNSVIDDIFGVEYFWRAYPASAGSRMPENPMYPSGTLEIIPYTQITLAEADAAVSSDSAGVMLSWTGVPGAAAYELEISASADMSSRSIARQIEGTRVTQTGLAPGQWYWRVTPVMQSRIIGALPSSEVGSFEIKITESPAEVLGRMMTDDDTSDNRRTSASLPAERQSATPARTSSQTTENIPVNSRWRSYIDRSARTTLTFTAAADEVVTATVGGTASFNRSHAQMQYPYIGQYNAGYTYIFEAWTQSGARDLTVGYYWDNSTQRGFEVYITITNIRTTYTIIGEKLPRGGNQKIDIHCADNLGTFYLKMLEIRESRPDDVGVVSPQPFFNRGIQFREQGDYNSAIAEFTEAIRIYPNFEEAYYNRGFAYRDRGNKNDDNADRDRALEDFNRAIRLNTGNNTWNYTGRGIIYREKGDFDRSLSDLNEAIRLDTNNDWARHELGWLYHSRRDYYRAIEEQNIALRSNPNSEWYIRARGCAYMELGDFDRAIADLNEAIRLNPNVADFYHDRGRVYKNRGNRNNNNHADLDRAIEDFTRAIQLNPNNSWHYCERGFTYKDKGDYDRALTDFNEALRINPNNASAYAGISHIYYERGNLDRYLEHANIAVNLQPGWGWLYHNRGWAYYHKGGNDDLALADFAEGLRLDPNQPDIYSGIGHVYYYRKQDYDRAIEAFENAVRLAPDNPRYKGELEMAQKRGR